MVRWPLKPLQPLQKTQLQPPFGPSVDSLCHPWFTTTNLSYRFPISETSTTALCGTTGSQHWSFRNCWSVWKGKPVRRMKAIGKRLRSGCASSPTGRLFGSMWGWSTTKFQTLGPGRQTCTPQEPGENTTVDRPWDSWAASLQATLQRMAGLLPVAFSKGEAALLVHSLFDPQFVAECVRSELWRRGTKDDAAPRPERLYPVRYTVEGMVEAELLQCARDTLYRARGYFLDAMCASTKMNEITISLPLLIYSSAWSAPAEASKLAHSLFLCFVHDMNLQNAGLMVLVVRHKKEEVELQNELFAGAQCRSNRPRFAVVDCGDMQRFTWWQAALHNARQRQCVVRQCVVTMCRQGGPQGGRGSSPICRRNVSSAWAPKLIPKLRAPCIITQRCRFLLLFFDFTFRFCFLPVFFICVCFKVSSFFLNCWIDFLEVFFCIFECFSYFLDFFEKN